MCPARGSFQYLVGESTIALNYGDMKKPAWEEFKPVAVTAF
jgi:hypothetical protein